jgi:hypothetical protein
MPEGRRHELGRRIGRRRAAYIVLLHSDTLIGRAVRPRRGRALPLTAADVMTSAEVAELLHLPRSTSNTWPGAP